jgi:hypothetical protein
MKVIGHVLGVKNRDEANVYELDLLSPIPFPCTSAA